MDAAKFRRRDGAPPFILGHRGVRGEAPENTMKAFELAASSGADGVELDVRLCRSGEVVVFHDTTLARMTQGRDARAVADLDLAELCEIDIGSGERVPLLDQVLRWAHGLGLSVNVEMKRDVPDRSRTVRETARVLERLGASLPTVIVSSFDPSMLKRFRWRLPGIPLGSLFGAEQRWHKLQTSGVVPALLGAEAVHPDHALVTVDRCRRWKRQGRLVNVWTVNEPAEAKTFADMGIDAIITDVPGTMVRILR